MVTCVRGRGRDCETEGGGGGAHGRERALAFLMGIDGLITEA